MRFFIFLLMIFCIPLQGNACSSAPRAVDADDAIIKKAAAILSVKVLSSVRNDDAKSSETIATAELEILDVYQGEFKKGGHIIAKSKNLGTCSRILSDGETADILLFEENGDYYLGSTTDFLYPETWKRLKAKN